MNVKFKKQYFLVSIIIVIFVITYNANVNGETITNTKAGITSTNKKLEGKIFYRNTMYKDVSIRNKVVRLEDSAEYVMYVFGIPKATYDSVHGWKWYVFFTDYTDLVFIGIKDDEVVSIFSNAKDFSYDNKIFNGTPKKQAVSKGYESFIYNDKNEVDGVYLRNNTNFTSPVTSGLIGEIFHLTNAYRVKNNSNILEPISYLSIIAQNYSNDMVERNFFSHVNPEGLTPLDRILSSGNKVSWCSENLANGFDDGIYAYEALINSNSHRENMLKDFGYTGVGVTIGEDNVFYFTQLFSNPM